MNQEIVIPSDMLLAFVDLILTAMMQESRTPS